MLVAASYEQTSMYGGPQKLYAAATTGDTAPIVDDTPRGDGVLNLPSTGATFDATGEVLAYQTGARATSLDAPAIIIRLRDAQSWNLLGDVLLDPREPPHERCSKLASGGARAFLCTLTGSDGFEDKMGEVVEITPKGVTRLGLQAKYAERSHAGSLLLLQQQSDATVLTVSIDEQQLEVARNAVWAAWAPPLVRGILEERSRLFPMLSASDRGYADPLRGVGWGNRCLARLKAKDLAAARAACEMGLTLLPATEVAAALHYNLSLIAEREANTQAACAEVERSLALRPNNAATLARAKKLDCKAQPD
ncbi:MAG TPA: hypothetical protein VNG33_13620 [Polyangiaceae bacterium]|nr:hypothetical protein [Polyangiaceae bacterium]